MLNLINFLKFIDKFECLFQLKKISEITGLVLEKFEDVHKKAPIIGGDIFLIFMKKFYQTTCLGS